jgi:hypothetical protein
MRDKVARDLILQELGGESYMDPSFRRRGFMYGQFLTELFEKGILEKTSVTKETVGAFFVPRKDKKMRLIFDTRRANAHFMDPDGVRLCSGDSLAELEFEEDSAITVAAGDVQCCFYQYLLPAWARPYFTLPPIQGRYLPASVRRKLGHTKGLPQEVTFCVRVVPMGWSHSVRFVQRGHEYLMRHVSPQSPWLLDGVPSPALGGQQAVKILYIDNY